MYHLVLTTLLMFSGMSMHFVWNQWDDVFSPDPHTHIIRFSASDFPAESILLLSLDAYTFFPGPSGFLTLTNIIFNAYEGNSGSLAVEVYPYERHIEHIQAISFPEYSVVSLGTASWSQSSSGFFRYEEAFEGVKFLEPALLETYFDGKIEAFSEGAVIQVADHSRHMAGDKWQIHRVEMDISGLTHAISARSSPKIHTSGRMVNGSGDPSIWLIMQHGEKVRLSPEGIACHDDVFAWWVKSRVCLAPIEASTLKQAKKVLIDYGGGS